MLGQAWSELYCRRTQILAKNSSRLGNEHLAFYCCFQYYSYVFLHKIPLLSRHPLLCLILFGMKGSESDLLTYVLHLYIIKGSATRGWVSRILCPSYRIKSSKIHVQNIKIMKSTNNSGIENGGLLINIICTSGLLQNQSINLLSTPTSFQYVDIVRL